MTAGTISRYESIVVEMAMLSTTRNAASVPPWKIATAETMNAVAITPDMTFTRTGVPSRRLNTPNHPQKAPS